MKRRVFCIAVVLGLFTTGAEAQDQPSGYHRVACIKVKPGQGAGFRQFNADAVRRFFQASADSGEITGWYLLRTVIPAGSEAACDYVAVTLFTGLPRPPMGLEEIDKGLKRAGVAMSGSEFVAKREEVSSLVSMNLSRQTVRAGAPPEKGDYAYVNFMKVHSMQDWMDMENNVWKPMAASFAKEGHMRGWSVNLLVLPSGTDTKFQAVTLDVFPSWEAAFKPLPVADTFKQVHPGKDAEQTFEKLLKSRDLARRELLVFEEKVVPAR
jgi:hypothetical protein